MTKKAGWTILILQALSWTLLACAWRIRGFADWWAAHVFKWWTAVAGTVFGLFPFSVAEFILYALIIWAAGSLCIAFRQAFICRKMRKAWASEDTGCRENAADQNGSGPAGASAGRRNISPLARCFSHILLAASVLWFLFVTCSGINYQRTSFAESTGMEAEEYTLSELKGTSLWLTEKVNEYAALVERDEDGIMCLSVSLSETGRLAAQTMEELGGTYSLLSGSYPSPKPVTVSRILSLLSLTGMYSPLTIEANYNREMTAYNIPVSMCHELSHLKGFMQEQEANFIAFLACEQSESTDFRYSGYLLAWIHCTNALYDASRTDYKEVRALLCDEAVVDLAANSTFWDSNDGTLAEVSSQVNDTYLKANGQSSGVLSYEEVVDLLVTYWMENYAEID